MPNLNKNYEKLRKNYLFTETAKKIAVFEERTGRKVLRLGIGDVTLPLSSAAVNAMKRAAEEMGRKETFRGYGEEQGYAFLREAIKKYYADRGVSVSANDIFISDGAKSDCANLSDLFDENNTVLLPDPVYPAYADVNVMAGRKIVYAAADESNGFLPEPDENTRADIVYLCSPNNPTGAAYAAEELEKWVRYAIQKKAVILYDAAYECFIPFGGFFDKSADDAGKNRAENGKDFPVRSIYEVPGADQCAIEVCSFSKFASFTGTRCGFTVIPAALRCKNVSVKEAWTRRQSARFNGVSYIVQRGAEAALSEAGMAENERNAAYYMQNARIIRESLQSAGVVCYGGYAPYVWAKCPFGMTGGEFFAFLLNRAQIAGTPGGGFGKNGENYFRFSAFCSRESALLAAERLQNVLNRGV
ncbi:MAG: aminotransferase class I/II-fold pyridoxal phosphate-dependent enzyme [Candidatus Borkfalkiaceae bacterium]|nr:aminotransferase class I/II-fold pyridoxal phosphate-dependent enzyme [Clostridia bacterium]MDY6223827.1 aminotransferase class I/II-fold pyridoxal phosphate-dependent enzyme [Christensenellaceae bacterium]